MHKAVWIDHIVGSILRQSMSLMVSDECMREKGKG